jgi:2-hydroxychromene-2-carboxylate isomerase
MRGESNLPAGLHGKVCYSHPVWSATWARGYALVGREVLIAGAGSAGELDDQALTHEIGAI